VLVIDVRSTSPLRRPPADYCPAGSDRWFTIPAGLDAGKTLFYSDHETAPGEEPRATVLFVHGNPECSYTYRSVRDALVASGEPLRLVAPDHIGFGLSDQADFEMVDLHHAENLRQLVDHLDLRDVTLVVHDWGGPIGVGAMLERPSRVAALAVVNSTVFPMPPDGFTYRNYPFPWLPWYLTPSLVPDALWGGVAAAVVRHGHPQPAASFLRTVARWVVAHGRDAIDPGGAEYVFSQMLRGRANARSSKRNVRQTPFWGHGYRYRDPRHGVQDNHGFYARIHDLVPRAWGRAGADIPVCGWFGGWDACGKDSVIAQWQHALPRMREHTHRRPHVGHFVEEVEGPAIAASILELSG
jgi:cis-3-alkyl-4-acyloxetan-2-one decarboxylase